MRRVYVTLTGLLVVSVVIQFYFAAFGVFTAPENDSQFILHLLNGRFVLPLLCLLCIAAAAIARAPGRLIGFTAIPLGLLVMQTMLFIVAGTGRGVAGEDESGGPADPWAARHQRSVHSGCDDHAVPARQAVCPRWR